MFKHSTRNKAQIEKGTEQTLKLLTCCEALVQHSSIRIRKRQCEGESSEREQVQWLKISSMYSHNPMFLLDNRPQRI